MNYDFINNDETIIIEGKASKTIFLGFNEFQQEVPHF